jgi:hypothetical protein
MKKYLKYKSKYLNLINNLKGGANFKRILSPTLQQKNIIIEKFDEIKIKVKEQFPDIKCLDMHSTTTGSFIGKTSDSLVFSSNEEGLLCSLNIWKWDADTGNEIDSIYFSDGKEPAGIAYGVIELNDSLTCESSKLIWVKKNIPIYDKQTREWSETVNSIATIVANEICNILTTNDLLLPPQPTPPPPTPEVPLQKKDSKKDLEKKLLDEYDKRTHDDYMSSFMQDDI